MKGALFRSIVQPLKDFLFPPLCLVCRERLASADIYLCASCSQSLVRVDGTDYTMTVLKDRFAESRIISSFYPLYYFEEEGVLQHVIHALKYEEMTVLGEMFGESLGRALLENPKCADICAIVPVPLHAQKERERGYNQSEYICSGIARVTNLPLFSHAVRRPKNTRSQTKLSATDRQKNMKDAFEADVPSVAAIRGNKILLVDDVITTGATVQSCARALHGAGVKAIVCASIGIAKLDAPLKTCL